MDNFSKIYIVRSIKDRFRSLHSPRKREFGRNCWAERKVVEIFFV